jgi:hypothetical protein
VSSGHRVEVVKIDGRLFVQALIPIAEVCNPDTLGAANNPEEFVMPVPGEDVSYFWQNYLK